MYLVQTLTAAQLRQNVCHSLEKSVQVNFTKKSYLTFSCSSRQNTVNSLYGGHCRDLKLVSAVARVRNSGSLFQSNVSNLFLPGIYLLSVLSGCPL